jgi:hypothetical protein
MHTCMHTYIHTYIHTHEQCDVLIAGLGAGKSMFGECVAMYAAREYPMPAAYTCRLNESVCDDASQSFPFPWHTNILFLVNIVIS